MFTIRYQLPATDQGQPPIETIECHDEAEYDFYLAQLEAADITVIYR